MMPLTARSDADPEPPTIEPRRPGVGLSTAAQAAWGKSLRADVPRKRQGGWTPAADRPDPVALLEEQSAGRVPDLVPIRYGRMLATPFTFLRGSALVMTADLARTPSTGIFVQACGDAHLSNFGMFMTPERHLLFDLNDFDETYLAPFEWDVKRLAASGIVAARDNGFSEAQARAVGRAAAREYRLAIRQMAALPWLQVWYQRTHPEAYYQMVLKRGERRIAARVKALISKAQRRDHLGALDRFAYNDRGTWKIRHVPPLIVHQEGISDNRPVIRQALIDYAETLPPEFRAFVRRYRLVDVARKVVGVGSVGTEAYMILFLGDHDNAPIFLQAKEAGRSVLERYTTPDLHEHQGERVVIGQRLMQAASDPFLGWFRGTGERGLDYYVRQLLDGKASIDISTLYPAGLVRYVEVCAQVLARAHARSGDAPAIAGYLGSGETFDTALESFAVDYAEQTVRDHAALVQAEADGRISASRGL